MIDTIEAAKLLGVSTQTLWRWRKDRNGPPWYRVGEHHVRYKAAELEEWMSARVKSGEPPEAPE